MLLLAYRLSSVHRYQSLWGVFLLFISLGLSASDVSLGVVCICDYLSSHAVTYI